jgi:hypothetical protein
MTEQLARRCARVLSCGVAPAAVMAATARTASQPGLRVERRVLPGDWPDWDTDLIVFCEFLYYFGGPDLQRLLDLASAALRPGGTLVAVRSRHPMPEFPRSGDNVRDVPARAGSAALPATRSRT